LRITTRLFPDGATLAVVGDIDHETLPAFRQTIAQAVERAGPHIVLDFSAVTYIDSAGVSALFDLAEGAGDHRVLDIEGLSRPVRGILDISGLSQLEHVRLAPSEQPAAPLVEGRQTVQNEKHPKAWTQTFPSQLAELGQMRKFVQEVADDTRLEPDKAFALKVSVSEAAANAIEHGGSGGDVVIQGTRTPDRLAMTISHPGAFKARVPGDASRGHRGMGLPLMLGLVDEVTVSRPSGGGTMVTLSLFLQ
jgi:anti-anti-sigma factor